MLLICTSLAKLKEFNDNKGCSLIIVNSIKGKNLIDNLKNIKIKHVDGKKALKGNPSYFKKALLNPFRKIFFKEKK